MILIIEMHYLYILSLIALTSLAIVVLSRKRSIRFILGFSGIIPYYVSLKPGHAIILGKTGSGKSNTAKIFASSLSKVVPVLVFDWAGEYTKLENFRILKPGENFSINPLYPSGDEDFSEFIDFLVDLFGDTFNFSEPQRFMFRLVLKEAFKEKDVPTLLEVLKVLERLPPKSYYDNEIKMAIKRRIAHLVEGRTGKALCKNSIRLEEIFESNVVIDLSVFRSVHGKKLFVLLMLKLLYDYFLSKGIQSGRVVHVTIIEEAWNVIPYRRLDAPPSIGERLFAELRKYGECLVAVAQSPVEIAWSVVKNSNLIIMHSMLSKDAESIGLIFQGEIELEKLRKGEAYVLCEDSRKKIKIPKYDKKLLKLRAQQE